MSTSPATLADLSASDRAAFLSLTAVARAATTPIARLSDAELADKLAGLLSLRQIRNDNAYMLAQLCLEENTRGDVKETEAWLRRCRALYLLSSVIVKVEIPEAGEQERFLWQLFIDKPLEYWEDFAKDILGLAAPKASHMVNVWDVYINILQWPLEKVQAIGKSKLTRALGHFNRELRDGRTDDELTEQMQSGASYNTIEKYVQAARRPLSPEIQIRPVKFSHGVDASTVQLTYTCYEPRMDSKKNVYDATLSDTIVISVKGRRDKRLEVLNQLAARLKLNLTGDPA